MFRLTGNTCNDNKPKRTVQTENRLCNWQRKHPLFLTMQALRTQRSENTGWPWGRRGVILTLAWIQTIGFTWLVDSYCGVASKPPYPLSRGPGSRKGLWATVLRDSVHSMTPVLTKSAHSSSYRVREGPQQSPREERGQNTSGDIGSEVRKKKKVSCSILSDSLRSHGL